MGNSTYLVVVIGKNDYCNALSTVLGTRKCSIKELPDKYIFKIKGSLEAEEKQRSRRGEAVCGNPGKFFGQNRTYTGP